MEELGIEIFIKTRDNLPLKYKLVTTNKGMQCLTNKEIIQKRSIFWIYNIDDDHDMNIVPDTVIPRSLFLRHPLLSKLFDYAKDELNFSKSTRGIIFRRISSKKKNNTYSNYNSHCKCGMCNSIQSNGKSKLKDLTKSIFGSNSYDKYSYDNYSYYKNAIPYSYKSDN